jgi:hypothetical protein
VGFLWLPIFDDCVAGLGLLASAPATAAAATTFRGFDGGAEEDFPSMSASRTSFGIVLIA